MSWSPPHPPTGSFQSTVAYWQAIFEIPLDEPGAEMLREMAAQRLAELEVAVAAGRHAKTAARQASRQHAEPEYTRRLPA